MRDLIRDLRISVANLDSGDDRSFEFFLPQDAWQIPDDQVEPRAPLEIEGNIVHAGDFFVLKVNVKTRLKMECTRCLSDFEQDFVLDIEEELKKADSYDTLSDELEDEEESYSTFSGQEINLGEIIEYDSHGFGLAVSKTMRRKLQRTLSSLRSGLKQRALRLRRGKD